MRGLDGEKNSVFASATFASLRFVDLIHATEGQSIFDTQFSMRLPYKGDQST